MGSTLRILFKILKGSSDLYIRCQLYLGIPDMIILQCRRCNGTGKIPNEQFRICQELTPETRRYFHIQTENIIDDEDETQHDACRNIPEKITCPACEGMGIITFDEEEWELRIVADEENETEL
jgi:hypothetical protein